MTSLRPELELRPKWLSCWPGHVTLVEPSIGSTTGAPDASLTACGASYRFDPGWVEFKAMDADGHISFRPAQRLWMKQFLRHSIRCAVVSMDKEGFYIHHCREFIQGAFQQSYSPLSLPSPIRKIKWADIQDKNLPKLVEMVYISAQ